MQTNSIAESNRLAPHEAPLSKDPRAIRILAKTVYRDLCTSGYDKAQVVAFTSELLDLINDEMQRTDA